MVLVNTGVVCEVIRFAVLLQTAKSHFFVWRVERRRGEMSRGDLTWKQGIKGTKSSLIANKPTKSKTRRGITRYLQLRSYYE